MIPMKAMSPTRNSKVPARALRFFFMTVFIALIPFFFFEKVSFNNLYQFHHLKRWWNIIRLNNIKFTIITDPIRIACFIHATDPTNHYTTSSYDDSLVYENYPLYKNTRKILYTVFVSITNISSYLLPHNDS